MLSVALAFAYLACDAFALRRHDSARTSPINQFELSQKSSSMPEGAPSRRKLNRRTKAEGALSPQIALAELLCNSNHAVAFPSASGADLLVNSNHAVAFPFASGVHTCAYKIPHLRSHPAVWQLFRSSHCGIQMMSADELRTEVKSLQNDQPSVDATAKALESARSEVPPVPVVPAALSLAQWFARGFATIALFFMVLTASPQALPAVDTVAATPSYIAREVVSLLDKNYIDRDLLRPELKRVSQMLEDKGPLTEEQSLEVAMKLVSSLGDPYTRVLTPEEAAKLNRFDVTGVGVNFAVADNGDMTIGTMPPADSEASRRGVKFGDRVTMINGKSTRGMTSFDALDAVQKDSSVVSLKLKPAKGRGERQVSLRRSFQVRNPVTYKLYNTKDGLHKIGYIKLRQFDAQGKLRLREAVNDLEALGASRLVLDLRGNYGGVLDGALGIAGFFLERPLVLFVTDGKGAMQPLYSREGIVSANVPLQLWIDKSTASSAEVLAGALRDNCRASLVGKRTFGKGVIQGVYGLSDGGALIETIASYSTPAGIEINGLGIGPDVERTFMSDIFGERFIDQDLKAASKIFDRDHDSSMKECQENPEIDERYVAKGPGTLSSAVATGLQSGKDNTQQK